VRRTSILPPWVAVCKRLSAFMWQSWRWGRRRCATHVPQF